MKSISLVLALALASGLAAAQSPIAGIWTGSAQRGPQSVPIRLEISGAGDHVSGAWINGDERSPSTSGSFQNGHLVLHFDYYANTLDATVRNGSLTGTFAGHARPVQITATLGDPVPATIAASTAPVIAGDWQVQVKSPKGESAWKLHVRQSGAQVVAAILRIDGDTGNLYGFYANGQFALSHFTAAGPSTLVLEPEPDGTLKLVEHSKTGDLIARRPGEARRDGLPGPDDPLTHTSLDDPSQPLAFSFPDLNGKLVSNTDPRFRGKVVIVAVGGSWCPNCHDEAPFLEQLYRAYHRRGLEIVNLSFEEQDQLQNPTRLRAFIERYGIEYPVLLAGEPKQLNEKLPQVEGLDCWPTTFFIGRDGLVKAVHAGYAGLASGQDHTAEVQETNHLLQTLLSQP